MLDEITLTFALADDFLKARGHREHAGCRMTDAEVMACALTAARFFGGRLDHARLYMAEHGLVPRILSKSQLGRRVHRLADTFGHLFDALAASFKGAAAAGPPPVFALDTMPFPALDNARIPIARLYTDEAFRGYQASKRRYYYGLKLHLVVDAASRPVECMLTPGSVADVRGLYGLPLALPEGSALVGDKAYNDAAAEALLLEDGVELLPLRRANMTQHEGALTEWIHRHRKGVETAFSGIARLLPRSIAAVTAAGFELRVFLFVLAYAITCL